MTIYIPPFANVRLIECRDFMTLVPFCAYREFFGHGKIKAGDVPLEGRKGFVGTLLSRCSEEEEIWPVMSWKPDCSSRWGTRCPAQ